MRKFISVILTACMLLSFSVISAFSVSAANDDKLLFSTTSAEAKPGDTVDITVNIDQNPGFWSANFLCYYSDKLTLRDISYGDITPENYYLNSEYNLSSDKLLDTYLDALKLNGVSTEGLSSFILTMTNEASVTDNITGTGKMFTLSFEVSADAPNGDYTIGFTISDTGNFVDAVTLEEVPIDITNGKITVTGSTVTSDPEVNFAEPTIPGKGGSDGYYEAHPEYAPEQHSSDQTNAPETDADGNSVVSTDTSTTTEAPEYHIVTDESGKIVYETDAEGNSHPKTEKVTDAAADGDSNNTSADKESPVKTIAIVAGIVLVCAGAAGIILVFATKKKNGKDSDDSGSTADGTDLSYTDSTDTDSSADESSEEEHDMDEDNSDESNG